jgi:hypothetical protein
MIQVVVSRRLTRYLKNSHIQISARSFKNPLEIKSSRVEEKMEFISEYRKSFKHDDKGKNSQEADY